MLKYYQKYKKPITIIGIIILISIIIFSIIILIRQYENLDNCKNNNCPKTCPVGTICPPDCLTCNHPSPSPPSPTPPSPTPPSTDVFTPTSDYPLITNLNKQIGKETCLDDYNGNRGSSIKVNNWASQINDTKSKLSSNYPVGYSINTNIFIINKQDTLKNLASKFQNMWNNCGFPYAVGQGKACNNGGMIWGPVTILLQKGTYDFSGVQFSRYFYSIFGIEDDVNIKNLKINNDVWANSIDNCFFMTIQNCTIIDDGTNFDFPTSQGTSLVKCDIQSKTINVMNGSPGYMRDCILTDVDGSTGYGCQQYLFNRCNIKGNFKRADTTPEYIFGMLNCNSSITSTLQCSSISGKNLTGIICRHNDCNKDYINPNITYNDSSILNQENISIDKNGVYKYTKLKDDSTTASDKMYWKNIVILNQDTINSTTFKSGYCYILPGGNYYITKSLTIPSKSIFYGLGFAVIIPTYTQKQSNVITMSDNSYICNFLIYSPGKDLSDNILYVNDSCKIYNTHTRIIPTFSNITNNTGSMIYIKGNNNYLEHSWNWIADHDACLGNQDCCDYSNINYGLNIVGNKNTFVGMFVEHQQIPINIEGDTNKLIWSQGEGYYKSGSSYYLNIGKSVSNLLYVMGNIFAINNPFKKCAINFEKDKPVVSKLTSNDLTTYKNGIVLQDFVITGWTGSGGGGEFPIFSLAGDTSNSPKINMSPQQFYYLCDLLSLINK